MVHKKSEMVIPVCGLFCEMDGESEIEENTPWWRNWQGGRDDDEKCALLVTYFCPLSFEGCCTSDFVISSCFEWCCLIMMMFLSPFLSLEPWMMMVLYFWLLDVVFEIFGLILLLLVLMMLMECFTVEGWLLLEYFVSYMFWMFGNCYVFLLIYSIILWDAGSDL